MNKDIISLAPPRSIKNNHDLKITKRNPHRRRRATSSCGAISSCDANWSKIFNQDRRTQNDYGREREGNRLLAHVGVIPTCPPTKYQQIQAITTELHEIHQCAAKSGNILISKHGGKWHAGVHPEYG